MSMMRKQRRGQMRRSLRSGIGILAAGALMMGGMNHAMALPQGGQVAAGAAEIAASQAEMAIHQATQNAVINWNSFNIGAGERVNIYQPNAQAALLNRVIGNNPSEIFGTLSANGRVFLVNPAGVLFAPGAQVDAGSIVASTMNITNADFMAGKYAFVGTPTDGKIINRASLIAKNEGTVALLGKDVVNEGVIVARKGAAVLAAGEAVSLDFNGDGKVSVVPTKAAMEQAVTNKGLVEADGGLVFMSAATGDALTRSAVNQEGIVRASSLDGAAGSVRMTANDVRLASGSVTDVSGAKAGTVEIGGGWQGTGDLAHAQNVTIERGAALRADATQAGASGGTVAVWSDGMTRFAGEITARGKGTGAGGAVETSGKRIHVTGAIDVSSENGRNGKWLLDPGNLTIKHLTGGETPSDSLVERDTVNAALDAGGDIEYKTGNDGEYTLTVQHAITKTSNADSSLKLAATGKIEVNAPITSVGGKLNLELLSDTNAESGGAIKIADSAALATKGGDVTIHGGKNGFATSENAGTAGITIGTGGIDTTNGTAGGNIRLHGAGSGTAVGIQTNGALNAGAGSITLIGQSQTGTGISIGGNINTRTVELRTDKLNLAGTITGDNHADGSAKVWTLSADKTINFGAGTGGLDLAGDTFTSTGNIRNFKKNIVGDATQKANITASGVTADEDLEMYTGAGTLTVSGAVDVAAGHALTLGSKNTITGAGVLTSDALVLDAADATVNLTGTQMLGKLDGKAKGLTLKNGTNLTVGGETGLTTSAGGADIEVTAGDLTVGTHGITNGAGAMKLKASGTSGTLKLDANAEVKSTGAAATSLEATTVNFDTASKVSTAGGTIDLKTDALTLPAGAQGTLSSANGKVTVDTKTAGKKIAVGSSAPSDLVLPNLDFINSGTGEIQIGSAATGNVEIGTADVKAPLTVESGATIKFSGAMTNAGGKDTTFKANTIDFASGANLASGAGTMTMTANSVTNWNDAAFADTNGAGTFVLKPKTAGNFTVGGTAGLVTDAGFGKLKAGNFKNVSVGAKDNGGTATIAGIASGNLPKYTSILTKGKIDITGAVNGTSGDTLALHADAPGAVLGDGLSQSAPIEVGNLLLLGKGSMDLSTQANKIENIAADMSEGDLKLKNQTNMTVAVVENRTVTPEVNVDGLKTKSMDIQMAAGQTLTVEGKLNSTDDTKIEADDLDLGTDKVNVGNQLTLEKATKTQTINVGTGSNDWNINNANYGKIKIGGSDQDADINIKGATFKNPSDIETKKKVTLTGTNKAGADGKSNMKIKAKTAELPTASDTLAVKNLDLDLSGGIDLGNGKVHGAEGGKVTTKGASNSQDIVISNNASDAGATDFRISYRTINDTLTGFSGFDVAGEQKVRFYQGEVKKSINAAGKKGVEVHGNLTIEGVGTKLKISSDRSAVETPLAPAFVVKEGKTVHVKGSGGTSKETGAEINIQTEGNIQLEKNAKLMVEGNYAQATLNARNGDVVLNEDAKVQVAPGSTPVWVDVTGKKLQLDARAQLDSGTDTQGALRVHTDEIVTPTADDNTTNIVGKSGLVITRKTAGDLTLNNSSTGAGLHVTSEQLNGKLFGNQFSELVLGDDRSQTVTIDGLEANNRVVVKTADTGKTVIGAGGLKVGTDGSGKPYNVTLTTGAIENSGGAGVMNIGEGSALNLYTNSIANLTPSSGSPSVTGTGTLGIGTYNGTKTIGLGDGATGDLQLTNNKFTQVFGPNFSHYSIGNGNQGTINVAGSSLTQDVTLQANNINFAGDMTLAQDKTLVVNAKTAANQTAGKIKATKLAAVGGNIALEKDNEIGTLAADALSVKVKSNALTIGAITTPAGAPVASRTITGVKAGEAGGTAGDIVLSADSMTFNEGVAGKGNLTIQQATAATNLNVGATGGTGLTLPANLFGGNKIKDGFKHVYLGREDASGATKVGGTLNFVDPTTIRSGKTAGSMTVDGSANIQTNGNDFALESKDLTTAAGSSVDTGTGALTLKTDAIDLKGKMKGKKALNILPISHNRDLKLGGTVNDPTKLSLLDKYFNGNDRQFWEYEIINIGDEGGGGRLYQSGTIDMPFTVKIQQAITSGQGGVNLSGSIKTHGRDYTVASREVNLDDAHINADGADRDHDGNVAIHADKLNTANGSTITGHGDVSFDTYTPGKTLNFGTPGAGGSASDPTLPSDIFSGTGLLRKNADGKGFKKIRIGGTNAGDIKVGNVDLPEGLADAVSIKTNKDVTSTGVLKSVPTLEVDAHSVNLTGANEIKNLGNITSATGVTVETKGGTNVTGKITGTNAPINITNKNGGNVTIAPGGQIVGTGTSDVLIEAKGGAFKNKGGANAIQTAPGQRYVVHTEDSVENEIDGLVFEFRRYGTDYTQRGSITIPAGKNAMFYKYQPELTLYSTRAYGDANGAFFNDGSGYRIIDDGNEKRRTLDAAERADIYNNRKATGQYNYQSDVDENAIVNADISSTSGTGANTIVNTDLRSGAPRYGTDASDANKGITFEGNNPLNYKIKIDFRIVPRVVTVKGKTETVTYNGNPHNYTGTNGVTFENFANGQTAATPGLLSGAVSYTPIADSTQTTGYAQGAIHAGEYTVGLSNSNLSASNYTFKYVPGKLTIDPIAITFATPNGERIYGAPNDAVTMASPSYTGTLASGDTFAQYTVTAVDGGGNPVTERTGIGTYTMSLQGVGLAPGSRGISSDYRITAPAGTLTIKKRPLTITAGDKSRVYGDANTTAGYINNTAKVNVGATTATAGLVNGDAIDDVTETIDSSATVTTNAGTAGLWTKASDAHFSSGTANNYNITYVDGHFNITKRPLTLLAGDKSRIYGTANSTANYVGGTNLFRVKAGTNLVNGDAISTVTETIDSRATVTTDAGTPGLKTKIANAVFGTGNANNYDISYEDGSFAITPRDLTLRAGNKTRIYGTENSTAVYTGGTSKFRADAATATTGLVSGDTIADVNETTNATVRSNVGESGLKTQIANMRLAGNRKASNYNVTYVDGGFAITKRDLYITAGDKSRIYGDGNETAQYVNGTSRLNVRPADATTGLVNGDAISSVTETIDPAATPTTNAGTGGLWTRASAAQFSHGTDANYNIHYADGNFAITKRALTLAAGDKSRIYGTANSTANYVNGTNLFRVKQGNLVNGDAISTVTETIDSRATVTTDAGTPGLKTQIANAVFGTGNASNYDISYEDGSFAITPRDLTLRAGDKTRIYGTENSTAIYTGGTSKFHADAATATTGLVNGDTIADVVESTNATRTTNVGASGLKTQITNARFGAGRASNYNIHYVDGGFDITKRNLYITAGDKSRIYGDGNETAQYVNGTNRLNVRPADAATGLVNGDTISSVTETIDPAATPTTNAGTGGLWTRASAAQFAHGTDANYNIHYADGNFAITKRALTLAAGDKSRVYGAENSTASYVNGTGLFRVAAGNLVNGDAISTVTETIDSRATVTTDAGTPGLKTMIGSAVFGVGNANNYDISYEDGSFAITPRDLTLRAGDKTRIYGTENTTAVYTGGTSKFRADAATATTGLVNGDAVADVTESTNATRTTNVNAAGIKTSINNATFRTGKASNYNISYVDGGFDITKRMLTIFAGNKSRAYGADNETATYVDGTQRFTTAAATATTGLVGGDTVVSVTETIDPTATVTTNAGTTGLWTRVADAQFGVGTEGNYDIRYTDGRFTIIPREVLITAGSASRDYGAPNPVITAYMIERGDHTSQRGLLAGDDITGITSHYDTGMNATTRGGTYRGVIHVDPASVERGYAGASARSNYRFNYAPGDLTIAMRGFDMSTPEGAAVTTSSAAVAQATTGTTNGGSGVTAAAVPTENRTGSNPPAEGVTVQMPQDAAPTNWANRVVVANDSTSEAHDFVENKDGSFGFDLGRTRGTRGFHPENPANNTSEAIPVLFTDGGSRDLDGIYTVNYSPEKLAIKPSSKKVDIPDPKEIRDTSAQALRFLYQTANGSFEVTFGNGIVTLYPQDEPALSIITAKDRKAERAVLASGLLTAIEDLGVTPVEIRAVYIFNVMDGQTAEE